MPSPDDAKFLTAAQGETNLAKVMRPVETFWLREDPLTGEPIEAPAEEEARDAA